MGEVPTIFGAKFGEVHSGTYGPRPAWKGSPKLDTRTTSNHRGNLIGGFLKTNINEEVMRTLGGKVFLLWPS